MSGAGGRERLIGYLRDELGWYQRRIEVTNAQAAGIITVTVAFAGVAVAGLAAVHRSVQAASIILLVLGAFALAVGVIRAFSVMDTSNAPAKWFTLLWNWWEFRQRFYKPVEALLAA